MKELPRDCNVSSDATIKMKNIVSMKTVLNILKSFCLDFIHLRRCEIVKWKANNLDSNMTLSDIFIKKKLSNFPNINMVF